MNFIWKIIAALTGRCRVCGYQNVYKSGYFHRRGKPGMYDRHAGDLYPTKAAALADIDPPSHYVGTTKVTWWESCQPAVNDRSSCPVPLSQTRRVEPTW